MSNYELSHKPISGWEFIPEHCGACENCATVDVPMVCERCSYTDTWDFRQPVTWPCLYEKQRLEKINIQKRIEINRRRYEQVEMND